jgi:hypothetical protein
MATARIAGLLVEKREIGAAGCFDRSEMLDAIAARHGPEVAEMLAKALGDYQREPDEPLK